MTDPEKVPIFLMFVGHCVLADKKIGQEFRQLPNDWRDAKWSEDWPERVFSNIKVGQPGHVYSVDSITKPDGSNSIYPATMRWVERWHDDDRVSRLQAENDARRMAWETERRGKKEQKRKLYLERLEPIRRVMYRLPAPEKMFLVFKVIQALMSTRQLTTGDDDDDD